MPEPRSARSSVQDLLLVGASHRGATAALRERLFLDGSAAPAILQRLKQQGFGQALTVVTSDRCELYVFHPDPARGAAALRAILAASAGLAPELVSAQLFERRGVTALRHLFSVAASLDSPVPGEPQVLEQLKANHRSSIEAGLVGPELEAMLQAAYVTAGRVRSETPLAEQPVSMATAAIDVARELFGDLGRCSALMLGIGEMGERMAAELQKGGLTRLTVTHPAAARAELTARRLGCHFRDWAELDAALAAADIVIAALGAGRVVVTTEAVKAALKARRHKPMLLLDAALPPDIEAAVGELDDAFRYDLDDLERLAMEGRTPRGSAATRRQAAETAARILAEETARFEARYAEPGYAPALAALRAELEAERAKALAEAGGDAEAATRLLVNRLLQRPEAALKAVAGEGKDASTLAALLGRLFGIDGSTKEKT
ncbi:MAG TPA: glutamyl-tRNA reductase [Hypericibacter adhaerens]|jgi:glutamyl-tRNA reductase|uniref:Glutamyl-tRNA reductase n=1 Tax=Hypericibacter adhaerens TaxID=2602016 RepID=A0A5J6N3B6_9PROT|nr:glutamyl-tRNA reductase [Hypericibacter adhaerens]QEX24281.1 glutamyl-tRNA reductase [Hypericibacter adhaerens]HWA43521.1 glutamyl-tRNA reductase [Hypericibacter adhaerens]